MRCACRAILALALLAALVGCSSRPDRDLRTLVARGDFARAAARIETTMARNRKDRDFLLDRLSLGVVRLADGRLEHAEPPLLEVFDVLRTQGVNEDKTVAAAVFGEEGVIFWKGEPFEQALAYTYVALHRAMSGEWDNARAAASSSLFLLRDFGVNELGERLTPRELAERAAQHEGSGADDEYLDHGYTPTPTNFALGHFLTGVANLALAQGDPARGAEARDHFREAFELNPALRDVADALISGRADTILVVDYGLGPRKVRYGPDGALARFAPITPSDQRPLDVRIPGAPPQTFPVACDVNVMAADHMWNNLEDIRRAKSAIGSGMMLGGAITVVAAGDDTAQLVGLGLLFGGLFTRATAQADIRHCEALPQRTYIAAIDLPDRPTNVTISVTGDPNSILTLPALRPPDSVAPLGLYYVRLPYARAPDWARAGAVRFGNDAGGGAVPGDELPWILGGMDVRLPTSRALARYQEAGFLTSFTLNDLRELYRLEGIVFDGPPPKGRDGRHILEGGRWLGAPAPGTTGFVRLFCGNHAPYEPRSEQVRRLARSILEERRASQALPLAR